MQRPTKILILLGILCIATILPFLGLTDFNTKGEPREAIVAYSMLESGNWILPINNGGDIAYKPPFFHWCIAFFSMLHGSVNEFTSRMPSAVALITLVLAGFAFYAKRTNLKLALIASLITLSNFEVHRAGANCRVDTVLMMFIVLALYQLYQWWEKGYHQLPWLAILFMSGATLTKGPVGIILPCLVAWCFMLLKGARFWSTSFRFAGIALASCLLPSLWYIAAYMQKGDTFLDLIVEENFARFTGKMSYSSHENPWTYNVQTLLAGYAPYTVLVLFSLFTLTYHKFAIQPHQWFKELRSKISTMEPVRLYSLLSIVLIFVFYCIPKSKRSVYLLPIYPFIAYFLAEYLVYLASDAKRLKALKAYSWTMAIVSLLVMGVFFALQCGWYPSGLFHGKHAAENIAYLDALASLSLFPWRGLVLLPLVGITLFFVVRTPQLSASAKALSCVLLQTLFLFLAMDGVFQPAVLNTKSDKPLQQQIFAIANGAPVYGYVHPYPGNMLRFFSINFYSGDQVGDFDAVKPEQGYLIIGDADLAEFDEKYGVQYQLESILHTTKRSCDTRSEVNLFRFSHK